MQRTTVALAVAAWIIVATAPAAAQRPGGRAESGTPAPDAPSEFLITDNLRLLTSYSPQVSLEQGSSNSSMGSIPPQRWDIIGNQFVFAVYDYTHFRVPFEIDTGAPHRSLQVDGAGNVGLGYYAYPYAASLHVIRGDGTAQLRVEEASLTTASRNLVRIKNNGASTFRFDNTGTGQLWGFGSLGSGNFFVGAAPGQPLAMTVTPAGNVTLTGTLTQNSDRDAKRDVEAVDAVAVLERVASMPLSIWSYKADEGRARHIGPMAQDFAAAFGFGADDRHVAPSDEAGVSLAAVQALKRGHDELHAALAREREERQRELAAKDELVRELEARLSRLEARLDADPGR